MKLIMSKNRFIFYIMFSFTLMLSLISTFVLPDRFFYDTKVILIDKFNEVGLIGSYPFTILFYKLTFLYKLPFFLIALIQFPLIMFLLYKIGIPEKFHILSIKNIIIYIGFVMIAIFLCMPSKEFINFFYIGLIPFVFIKNFNSSFKKMVTIQLIILFFGIFFRPYYLLIPIISAIIFTTSKVNFKNKTITSLFFGILFLLFLSISHSFLKGEYMSQTNRESLNSERTKDNNSMIVSPVETDTWYGETIGIFYGFFAINIPVFEGLKHLFSPQILFFVIWQLFLFYILLIRLSRCIKDRTNKKEELWLLSILFAYFIIQGLFEPDLGSAVRHKIGIFPLIYFALYYDDFRRKIR